MQDCGNEVGGIKSLVFLVVSVEDFPTGSIKDKGVICKFSHLYCSLKVLN